MLGASNQLIGCPSLFLSFIHHPHEKAARDVASFVFVPKAGLEREKPGVPSVLPRQPPFLTHTSLQEAVGFGYSFVEVRTRSGVFFLCV